MREPPGMYSKALVVAVARRPDLWWTAVRQSLVLARPGWWRRRPFLPLPDPGYLAFRMQTMYGDAAHAAVPEDVVSYLQWCRNYRQGLR